MIDLIFFCVKLVFLRVDNFLGDGGTNMVFVRVIVKVAMLIGDFVVAFDGSEMV